MHVLLRYHIVTLSADTRMPVLKSRTPLPPPLPLNSLPSTHFNSVHFPFASRSPTVTYSRLCRPTLLLHNEDCGLVRALRGKPYLHPT